MATMASDRLAALALLLALLGCVAHTCQASYGVPVPSPSAPRLRVGYYKKTCPGAEYIVKTVVEKALKSKPGLGAGIIRLAFHDCFVQVQAQLAAHGGWLMHVL